VYFVEADIAEEKTRRMSSQADNCARLNVPQLRDKRRFVAVEVGLVVVSFFTAPLLDPGG
jgi:hypothetical protein